MNDRVYAGSPVSLISVLGGLGGRSPKPMRGYKGETLGEVSPLILFQNIFRIPSNTQPQIPTKSTAKVTLSHQTAP